ncbi:MAG: PEP-CTERM sorting domain-containing protein [Nitrosomonas sp.]|nr:MAG: PEP-CTERM sorting domain-containing protein [Nitrosomonas sp.]
MNIKYQIKNLLLATSITIGLSATSAMANVVGFMGLELDGCFSSNANTAVCGPHENNAAVFATGTAVFNESLLSRFGGTAGLATQPFSYAGFGELLVGTGPGAPLAPFADVTRTWADYTALSSDPNLMLGFAILNQIAAHPNDASSSFTFDLTPNPGDEFSIFWSITNIVTNGSVTTGDWKAWSDDVLPLNGLSMALFGSVLPSDVNFNLNLTLNAIPEPVTLALVGLGILGMTAVGRRRSNTSNISFA